MPIFHVWQLLLLPFNTQYLFDCDEKSYKIKRTLISSTDLYLFITLVLSTFWVPGPKLGQKGTTTEVRNTEMKERSCSKQRPTPWNTLGSLMLFLFFLYSLSNPVGGRRTHTQRTKQIKILGESLTPGQTMRPLYSLQHRFKLEKKMRRCYNSHTMKDGPLPRKKLFLQQTF